MLIPRAPAACKTLWDGGPCYVHEAIDLGTISSGETKTASMNLGATLFAYKGNTCVKRVVIIEEGQHVRISAADVRTFSVGEKVNGCVEINQ